MTVDPDEPTRRLPPAEPPPVRERRTVVTGEPDRAWAVALLDRLRPLRTAVALVGVVAVAALAVGLWALLSEQADDDERRSASQARVAELSDRVDELEANVRDSASDDALGTMRDRQRQLDQRLTALEEQVGDGESVASLQDDVAQVGAGVEQLTQTIEQLEQRVDELEQQAAP